MLPWINANGLETEDRQWGNSGMRCFGMLLDGRAQTTGVKQRGQEATLLLVINDHTDLVEFTLPECSDGDTWELLIDTNILDNREKGTFKCQQKCGVTGHSFLVFVFNAENK